MIGRLANHHSAQPNFWNSTYLSIHLLSLNPAFISSSSFSQNDDFTLCRESTNISYTRDQYFWPQRTGLIMTVTAAQRVFLERRPSKRIAPEEWKKHEAFIKENYQLRQTELLKLLQARNFCPRCLTAISVR